MRIRRLEGRLSAAPTLFPTTVERPDSCAEFTVSAVSSIPGDRLLIQSVEHFHVWSTVRDLWSQVCNDSSRWEQVGMLKITITNTAKRERWTLQGRLVAPWVAELKANWNRTRRMAARCKCIVNLDEVTFIDKSGERMLRCMSRQGAQLVASDVYVKHVLDRLRGRSRPRSQVCNAQ